MSERDFRSQPVSFACAGARLQGIIDVPAHPSEIGVLVIVGGPQYRVGSHRQFTLLSRYLAGSGYSVMRFDHRGTGDSEGYTTFEALDPDIRAAIDELQSRVPSVREIVLWGLCDAASAAMMYANSDTRVSGLILLNPWARSEQTLARSFLRSYYLDKFLDASFWRKLATGKIPVVRAIRGFIENLHSALTSSGERGPSAIEGTGKGKTPFVKRMENGLQNFAGPVLFILSGKDITAREFETVTTDSRSWRAIMESDNITVHRIPEADHTFSQTAWQHRMEELTLEGLLRR